MFITFLVYNLPDEDLRNHNNDFKIHQKILILRKYRGSKM